MQNYRSVHVFLHISSRVVLRNNPNGCFGRKIQDVVMPVIDLETEPLPLEETIIVAGETQNKEWEAIPEPIKQGPQDLKKSSMYL